MYKFVLAALAAVAALTLGFGVRSSSTPEANADTTDVVVVACEFIASVADGTALDDESSTVAANFAAATAQVNAVCGRSPLPPGAATDDATDTAAGIPPGNRAPTVRRLAQALGDKDGVLEAADFRGDFDENWDANQISTDCTGVPGEVTAQLALTSAFTGLGCTLDVFVFVNDEARVDIDTDAGLKVVNDTAAGTPPLGDSQDAFCNTETLATVPPAPPAVALVREDNDCASASTAPVGLTGNGDGVVLFKVLRDTGTAGSVLSVRVIQETVEQRFDVNVVGPANDVKLTLAEDLIETNGSTAQATECSISTDVTDAIAPPNATLAIATAVDRDDTALTRVPVSITIQPPADNGPVAVFGLDNELEGITGGTFFTIDPKTEGAPNAFYHVICGGRSTGTTTIRAEINLISCSATSCSVLSSRDTSEQELTVGGAPSSVALAAVAPSIKCDGSEKSTVTATVTDSDGNNVADGVPVQFVVVALGTADPINTTTVDGKASTVVTPLSNSSAGVTVLVTAGDDDIKSVVQTSIRVDCALPLATQPVAPPPGPPAGRIGGPDTGNGGYLGQSDSAGLSAPMLLALAIGSVVLVAGGLVARRAGR